jgi:phage N-6-adenine-methyltransferase
MTEQLTIGSDGVTDTSVANVRKLAYVGAQPGANRDSDSWFTPTEYIDAARAALGGHITLDPFSSDHANEVVRATRYFTEEDDAFAQSWAGAMTPGEPSTVWMNPPYSGQLVKAAVTLFLDEYEAGTFKEGVFLVNNATETRWFQRAMALSSAVCFTHHRISFWNADGKRRSGNTRGQAFLYFGPQEERFADAFAQHGAVIFTVGMRPGIPRPSNKAQTALMEGK